MAPTWISPYASVWRSVFPESAIPFKQLAQALKPLTQAHPPERVAAELLAYLRATEPRYISLINFTRTFGTWAKPEPRKPHSQSVDEMDRNAGILP